MESKIRESNAELLRIICILLILLHHFCAHALYPEIFSANISDRTWDSSLLLFLHAFLYIGVDCFILISGWYGIKPKWRSFFNLYLIYSFYNLLHPIKRIIASFMRGEGFVLPYSVGDIIERTLLPFSHGDLWFMDCYLALFLMAPLLNMAIEHLDKKQFAYILGALTLLNVYFAYYWKMYLINTMGFSVSQFVYLYCIGAFLHKHVGATMVDEKRWKWFGWYLLFGVLWGCISLWSVSSIPPPLQFIGNQWLIITLCYY